MAEDWEGEFLAYADGRGSPVAGPSPNAATAMHLPDKSINEPRSAPSLDALFEELLTALCGPRRIPGWRASKRPPGEMIERLWGRRKRPYPRQFVHAFDMEFQPAGWSPELARDRLLSDWQPDESATDYAKRIILGHHSAEQVRTQLRPRRPMDEAAARRQAREAELDRESRFPIRMTSNGRVFR